MSSSMHAHRQYISIFSIYALTIMITCHICVVFYLSRRVISFYLIFVFWRHHTPHVLACSRSTFDDTTARMPLMLISELISKKNINFCRRCLWCALKFSLARSNIFFFFLFLWKKGIDKTRPTNNPDLRPRDYSRKNCWRRNTTVSSTEVQTSHQAF